MKRFILLASVALALATPAQAADKFTVMLDWFVNPDHAPIILAQQKGYFKDAGLDVEIVAPADPSDPPKMVAAGKADLAVTYQPQLYLQHQEGLPLVRVGTLISSPLYCLLTKVDGPIQKISDLNGHKIGFSVAGIEEAMIGTMLKSGGVTIDQVEMVNVNFSLVPALASGQVDAVSGAFRNFETHQLEAAGQKGHCFNPEDYGVPAYDELIYTANSEKMNKDEIKRFLAATERAEADIAADPAAAWTLFSTYAPELKDDLNHMAWADTTPHFAAHPASLDAKRYASFGDYMLKQGLIKSAPDVVSIAVDVTAK